MRAVDGVIDGVRWWSEDQPWWTVSSKALPTRFEDGRIDWDLLSDVEAEWVCRADAFLKNLWGRDDVLEVVPAPEKGIPCQFGWSMPIASGTRGLVDCGDDVVRETTLKWFHRVDGVGEYALEIDIEGERWLVLRDDAMVWATSREQVRTRAASVWVPVRLWRFDGYLELGANVEMPEKAASGRFRTIYVDHWPDTEMQWGSLESVTIPAPIIRDVDVDPAHPWYESPYWWKGLIPARKDNSDWVDIESPIAMHDRLYTIIGAYLTAMKGWNKPLPHYPRSYIEREIHPYDPLEIQRRYPGFTTLVEESD